MAHTLTATPRSCPQRESSGRVVEACRAADRAAASTPVCTVIQARACAPLVNWRELWRYRELLAFLAWRDVRVRYRQTLLGAGWAVLEPLINVILFTVIFNRLAGLSSGAVPYSIYCLSGVVVWTFFARALRGTTISLVANAGLLTKAYFPRLILPLAAQLATTIDLGCALLVYFALSAYYTIAPSAAILTLPFWIALAAFNALGVGLLLGAINVRFRDIAQALPFLTQVWMFATPVAYPLTTVPDRWLAVYLLNPMVAVVEGLRWSLLPDHPFPGTLILPGCAVASGLLWLGLRCFRRTERCFADIV